MEIQYLIDERASIKIDSGMPVELAELQARAEVLGKRIPPFTEEERNPEEPAKRGPYL